MKHVWIIEGFDSDNNKWIPMTTNCYQTRDEALFIMKRKYADYLKDYRIKKYIREV